MSPGVKLPFCGEEYGVFHLTLGCVEILLHVFFAFWGGGYRIISCINILATQYEKDLVRSPRFSSFLISRQKYGKGDNEMPAQRSPWGRDEESLSDLLTPSLGWVEEGIGTGTGIGTSRHGTVWTGAQGMGNRQINNSTSM